MNKLVLASASPRRRELLNNLGVNFEVVISETDEDVVSADIEPRLYVQELALLKASGSAKKIGKRLFSDLLVISADTVVVSDNLILGKPSDAEDAKRMLRNLSGKTHQVMTGICIFRISDGFSVCDTVISDVTFKELSDEMIDLYVQSGESLDKAGAYGIQGMGSLLCEKLEGDYFNVVGLPVSKLYDILKNEFDCDLLKIRRK